LEEKLVQLRYGKSKLPAGVRSSRFFLLVVSLVVILLAWEAFSQQSWAQSKQEDTRAVLLDFELDPLRPPELDSPHATLRSFIANTTEGINRMRREASPEAIRRAIRRAALTLDLSDIPLATRESVGTEKVLLLKEILDRVEIPAFENIPNAASVMETGLTQWTIPKTELTIVQIQEGPRAGDFLFSSRTVLLLEQFYELVKPLPYKPGASVRAYEDFLYGPGPLLPRSWVDGLPLWSHTVIAHQTLWQWISMALILAFVVIATVIVYACGKWWDEKFQGVSALIQFGKPLTSIFVILTMPLISILVDDAINFTGIPRVGLEFIILIATYGAAAWLAALIISRIGEGVINSKRLRSASLNSQLIRTITRLIALIVVIYVAVVAAESFGIPIAPLIAGLGIGGLAIALAVRPTLENIIGGFILFADKPVRVGDFCSFGNKRGTVVEIGMRSTQLRAVDRTIISVPNAQFANLRYETTADQLRYFLAKLREMLHAHPRINSETVRVRFSGYGDSSLNVTIRVYAQTREWNDFHAIREDVFLRVYDLVNEAGTGFAFPSRTIYMGKDEGLDTETAQRAADQVKGWRTSSQLPFPRFSPEALEKIDGTLDYPPRGSVDAFRPEGAEPQAEEPLSKETETVSKQDGGKDT
jgi:MscS family membrane protein